MELVAQALPWIQIILSVFLIAAILMQQTGAGLGGAFGGGGDSGATYHTRRGAERFLFSATIILATLFVLSALLALFIQ